MDNKDTVTFIYLSIDRDTPKAFLVNLDGYLVWLPKSQVQVFTDINKIEIPRWLAEENDLV